MDLQALGINITSIVINTILFLVIYLILNKLVIKPLISTLEKRQKEIAEGLSLREEMQSKIEQMELDKESIFNDAKKEAKTIIDQAMIEVKKEKKKLIEEARLEAEQIIKKSNEQLAIERKKLESDLNNKIELAASKVVKELYNQDKMVIDKKLINKAINEL